MLIPRPKIHELTIEQKAVQCDLLLNQLRMKVSNSDTPTQIQLLTLAPQNSSRESLSEFFGVSEYIIRESRELLKKSSILGDHKCRKGILKQIVITKYSHVVIGKVLSDEVIRTVEIFTKMMSKPAKCQEKGFCQYRS